MIHLRPHPRWQIRMSRRIFTAIMYLRCEVQLPACTLPYAAVGCKTALINRSIALSMCNLQLHHKRRPTRRLSFGHDRRRWPWDGFAGGKKFMLGPVPLTSESDNKQCEVVGRVTSGSRHVYASKGRINAVQKPSAILARRRHRPTRASRVDGRWVACRKRRLTNE